jgi:crossover junction endodeoxyribonuclease RuvC
VKVRRILGIDPGSHHLGLGCIEKTGNSLKLIFAEIIHAPKKDALYARLDHIVHKLRPRIDELAPDEIVVEDIFSGKNPRSAFHLGMARGVAIGTCLGRGIGIYEYAPTQVKMVVTGYGRADKEQVKKMVNLILGTHVDMGFDATDAIAVAICHANTLNLEALK